MNHPTELLAPAGNFEKLKTVLHYGADAVYAGLSDFSLRAQTGSFTEEDMIRWINFTHSQNKKIYITVNIFAHNEDLEPIRRHAEFLAQAKPDAVIVSDLGVFRIIRKIAPDLPIHISTQANTTNYESALFWQDLGAARIVLARELSIDEIHEIRERTNLEIEAFVHGSICIAYSGRCYISSYMSNRSGNKGECANSCRWNYHLVEEKRPGEYMPVYEDARGTQIMSAYDLKMVEYLDILKKAGVTSFKLEGRMKGINYAAGVVKVYREALDLTERGEDLKPYTERWNRELSQFSNRGFTTGMYMGDHPDSDYTFDGPAYNRSETELAGIIGETGLLHPKDAEAFYQEPDNGEAMGSRPPDQGVMVFAELAVRNTLKPGDTLYFLTPGTEETPFAFRAWHWHTGRILEGAKNEDKVVIWIPSTVRTGDVVRVRKKNTQ